MWCRCEERIFFDVFSNVGEVILGKVVRIGLYIVGSVSGLLQGARYGEFADIRSSCLSCGMAQCAQISRSTSLQRVVKAQLTLLGMKLNSIAQPVAALWNKSAAFLNGQETLLSPLL